MNPLPQTTASRLPVFFCSSLRPVLVGFLVDELERIGRLDVGVPLLEAAGVDQLLDAGAGADAEVMLAAGADVQRFLDDFAEEHVPAFGAAHPQAFGNPFLLHRFGCIAACFGHGRHYSGKPPDQDRAAATGIIACVRRRVIGAGREFRRWPRRGRDDRRWRWRRRTSLRLHRGPAAMVSGLMPPSISRRWSGRSRFLISRGLGEDLGHELLAGETGNDAHHQDHVNEFECRKNRFDRRRRAGA